jgi:catechol 2,3-dioxygenase-like lactoylglutathione lyase family enzyme
MRRPSMTCRIAQVTLDVSDIDAMSAFWSAALGYSVHRGDDGNATLRPGPDAPPTVPTMWLQAVKEPKETKNRCHIDMVSTHPVEEVERLLALGATRADVGQKGDERFDVLADPEGNEFCVLHRVDISPLSTLHRFPSRRRLA